MNDLIPNFPALPTGHLTDDIPGTGGVIRQRPEDFLVEEQPRYEPGGEGEHLYLYVEKNELTTAEAARRLARSFHLPRRSVSWAGLKDKHAVTRQLFSLHIPIADAQAQARALEDLEQKQERMKVLWTDRHTNKLRRGHHAGNRFVIRIRDVELTSVVHAKRSLDRLAQRGVPNIIGHQRFGFRTNAHTLGRLVLLGRYGEFLDVMLGTAQSHESEPLQRARVAYDAGDYARALEDMPRSLRFDRQALDALRQGMNARQAVKTIDRDQLKFLVNAAQSAVFNDVLARRLAAGTFDRLVVGDLAYKHEGGAVFPVDQAAAKADNAPDGRVQRMEVSPSGPMWGRDMIRADGAVAQAEADALANFGMTQAQLAGPEDFERIAARGSRRPLRIALRDPDISAGVDEHGAYIRLAFELPRGAFATTVLEEIMKTG